jgi:hypothetical protein
MADPGKDAKRTRWPHIALGNIDSSSAQAYQIQGVSLGASARIRTYPVAPSTPWYHENNERIVFKDVIFQNEANINCGMPDEKWH